jgi:DNA-binding GntR family transcriptional regulator
MTTDRLPRYLQIVEELLDEIERGEIEPGDRLPSERALSERFTVNRRTLRNSLDVLERRGLVERRQGAGTFITNPRFERKAGEFFPFTEGIRHRGFEPGSVIISLQRLPTSPSVAEQLQINESEEVWRFHRLRSVNGEPFLVETFSLPASLAPEIDTFDLSDRSVYDVLEHEYGVIIDKARLSLEAVAISEFEAELLRVPIGSPAMLERHLAFDATGRPVDYGYDVYRGDRVRFITDSATLPQDIPEYDRSRLVTQW